MPTIRTIVFVVFAATFFGLSCSNTGATASYCKQDESKTTADLSGVSESADGGEQGDPDAGSTTENDFSGLYCLAYHPHPDAAARLELNIINYWASCRGPFEAKVTKQTAVAAEIDILPTNCAGSDCLCPYDFTAQLTAVNLKADITVTIGRTSCLSESVEAVETAVLPLTKAPVGMVCQYMGTTSGGRHGPCRQDNSCDEGLICTETETLTRVEPVCLVSCETEADCPIFTNFTCDLGACHVTPGMTQTLL